MAVDGFLFIEQYDGTWLVGESQEDLTNVQLLPPYTVPKTPGSALEIDDFSFDVAQTTNIGSQATGAGAGKITFNSLSISRKIDKISPVLFAAAASGKPYQTMILALRKASGGTGGGVIYLQYVFKLVAVKTMSWSYDDQSPKETVSFDYGGLQIFYAAQQADGKLGSPVAGGWNRVKNVSDTTTTVVQ